jgi:hypothetical protein
MRQFLSDGCQNKNPSPKKPFQRYFSQIGFRLQLREFEEGDGQVCRWYGVLMMMP